MDQEEIERRINNVELFVKLRSGVLAKYAGQVSLADKGAILLPNKF